MSTSKSPQSTNVAWFDAQPSADQIPPATRRLLETYSGIPPPEITNHVISVRNQAWQICPYPCIGQFRFLEAGLDQCDEYDEVLARVSRGQKVLDMACCFGQTIRQLVVDGAPAKNVLGCDLEAEFIDLGYELFKDRGKLNARFLTADIFDSHSVLMEIKGQVDIIYAGSFFHLWGLEKQKEACKKVVSLLRPQPGSMIVGRQIGAVEAAEQASATGTMYKHNAGSFKKMWKDIGAELGVQFAVQAQLKSLNEHHNWETQGTKRLWFSVRRE